jgi:hypothetical protein
LASPSPNLQFKAATFRSPASLFSENDQLLRADPFEFFTHLPSATATVVNCREITHPSGYAPDSPKERADISDRVAPE